MEGGLGCGYSEACDAGQQCVGVDGLGEHGEIVGGAAGVVFEVDDVDVAGEEEDLAVGSRLFDGDGEIDAGHSGHEDVGDEVVGGDDLRDGERVFCVVGGGGCVVLFAEDCDESVCDEGFVVDYEDYWEGRALRGWEF